METDMNLLIRVMMVIVASLAGIAQMALMDPNLAPSSKCLVYLVISLEVAAVGVVAILRLGRPERG